MPGLFKLIGQQVIGRDEIVVVNCSGHTFPVEKELLGDEWTHDVEVPESDDQRASVPQEGLLSALERLDDRMRDVLIMDDTPEASRLLRRILQAYGTFNVREAENGRIGLEMVHQRPPDLILLDLMMPEMDGFAVLDTLKTDKELSKIPVIVVTAKELTNHRKAAPVRQSAVVDAKRRVFRSRHRRQDGGDVKLDSEARRCPPNPLAR